MKLKELLDVYENWKIELCIYDSNTKRCLFDDDLDEFAVWFGPGEVSGRTEEYDRILDLTVSSFVLDTGSDYKQKMIVSVNDDLVRS